MTGSKKLQGKVAIITGGTTGIGGVDHGDADPATRKLVRQREADQPAPGNGNVTVLSTHDRAG